MAATLAQMRSRVKIMVGGKTQIDDLIDDNLNEAILQLTGEVRPQELKEDTTFSAVSTQSEYTFNVTGSDVGVTDLYAVLMVRDNTLDREIKQGDEYEFNRLKQDTTDSSSLGDPNRWVRMDNSLWLYNKIPDSTTRTIGLWYLQRPATMTASQDFPLNEEWRKPVERLAAALTWTDLNKPALAAMHMSAYREMIALKESPDGIEDEAPEAQMVPVSNPVF
jgi:hypothetical protein